MGARASGWTCLVACWLASAGLASAQEAGGDAESATPVPPPPTTEARSEGERDDDDDDDAAAPATTDATASTEEEAQDASDEIRLTLGGYVEGNYTYSFGQPSNGVIAFRGFDNQHNTFTLANVSIWSQLEYERVYANVAVQWGNTPTTYYLFEPARAGTPGAGIGPSDASTWRWLQSAYAGWSIPIDASTTLDIEGGLFLSPIGFEGMAVSSNWNYSRSDLFFGCPFYHTGIRARLEVGEQWSFTAAVWNGWNTLLDNNDEKSFSVQADYAGDGISAHLLYFSGVERPTGYAGGRPWRHLFDAWVRGDATSWLSLALHANAGFEPTSFGLASWEAVAGYVHVVPIEWMAISLRGDFFRDDAPNDGTGNSQRIFWPSEWISSTTATVSFQPHSAITFYVEYRHDQAAGNSFYQGAVALDANMQPILNTPSQNTFTIGVSGSISGTVVGDSHTRAAR